MKQEYSDEILKLLNSVEAKRPRTVIQHILKHGFITTQELKDLYGYNHPPRAVRDVKDYGIPLETYRIVGTDNRKIAAYKFGDFSTASNSISKKSGRTILSKALKQALIEKYGANCFIYSENIDANLLQVDHRIPYEIGGETDASSEEKYMLLSPSANRAKSWSCEKCENWITKDPSFCVKCFWAYPESYEHIAGKEQRMITLVFTGNEIEDYNRLIRETGLEKVQQTIKVLIKEFLN